MEIVTSPIVDLISKPSFDFLKVDGIVKEEYDGEWDRSLNASDGAALVEFAGRVCYRSFGENQGTKDGTRAYIERIIDHKHGSVLEHANYTFMIRNVSRFYTHEQVRHRAGWAYSQESTRYVEYKEETAKIVSCGLEDLEDRMNAELALKVHSSSCFQKYREFMASLKGAITGKGKKYYQTAARDCLPANIGTCIVCTANLRAIRWFCEVRGSAAAAKEIRKVAIQILYKMNDHAPEFFGDMEVVWNDDIGDYCIVLTENHNKV